MIASLFRTMGIIPGGLGTFEATSVLMLRMVGVDLAVALAATLSFAASASGSRCCRAIGSPVVRLRARPSQQPTLAGY